MYIYQSHDYKRDLAICNQRPFRFFSVICLREVGKNQRPSRHPCANEWIPLHTFQGITNFNALLSLSSRSISCEVANAYTVYRQMWVAMAGGLQSIDLFQIVGKGSWCRIFSDGFHDFPERNAWKYHVTSFYRQISLFYEPRFPWNKGSLRFFGFWYLNRIFRGFFCEVYRAVFAKVEGLPRWIGLFKCLP